MSEDFRITDLKTLEWYTGKLTEISDQKARLAAQAVSMLADLVRDENALKFQFEAQARAVLADHLEHARGTAKHVKFLSGTIGFRSTAPRLAMTTNARALEWARTHAPDAITERLDMLSVQRRFRIEEGDGQNSVYNEHGEQIALDGLEIVPRETTMYVKPIAQKEQPNA